MLLLELTVSDEKYSKGSVTSTCKREERGELGDPAHDAPASGHISAVKGCLEEC